MEPFRRRALRYVRTMSAEAKAIGLKSSASVECKKSTEQPICVVINSRYSRLLCEQLDVVCEVSRGTSIRFSVVRSLWLVPEKVSAQQCQATGTNQTCTNSTTMPGTLINGVYTIGIQDNATLTIKRKRRPAEYARLAAHVFPWSGAEIPANSNLPEVCKKSITMRGSQRSGDCPLNHKFNGHWRIACPYQIHAVMRRFLPLTSASAPPPSWGLFFGWRREAGEVSADGVSKSFRLHHNTARKHLRTRSRPHMVQVSTTTTAAFTSGSAPSSNARSGGPLRKHGWSIKPESYP
jgi:hypothetical protein